MAGYLFTAQEKLERVIEAVGGEDTMIPQLCLRKEGDTGLYRGGHSFTFLGNLAKQLEHRIIPHRLRRFSQG